MRIWADYREEKSGVPELLKKLGVIVELRNLPVGDYAISNRVVVERKTVPDFLASIIDGRIFRQSEELLQVERPYIVIEGPYEHLLGRKISENAFWGALISLTEMGIHVIHVNSAEETAKFLYNLARREIERNKERRMPILKKKAKEDKEIALRVLASLPYVGEKTAERILERFGSLREFFSAGLPEISSIQGIEGEKGKKVFEIINKEFYPRRGKSKKLF